MRSLSVNSPGLQLLKPGIGTGFVNILFVKRQQISVLIVTMLFFIHFVDTVQSQTFFEYFFSLSRFEPFEFIKK